MEQATSQSWMSCTLCRAGREGVSTLQRAQTRAVQWPLPQIGLRNTLEDPEVFTSLDDAFSAMTQFMRTSSRKCKRYHHSHRPHSPGSSESNHYLRYHTDNFQQFTSNNPAPPGSYTVTAEAREGDLETSKGRRSVHHIKLEEGKAVTITLHL